MNEKYLPLCHLNHRLMDSTALISLPLNNNTIKIRMYRVELSKVFEFDNIIAEKV